MEFFWLRYLNVRRSVGHSVRLLVSNEIKVDNVRFEFLRNPHSVELLFNNTVKLDLGKTVIGSLTDNGFMSIWDKKDC